jgi:hypothetical protein
MQAGTAEARKSHSEGGIPTAFDLYRQCNAIVKDEADARI